jgi:hypothetical protein
MSDNEAVDSLGYDVDEDDLLPPPQVIRQGRTWVSASAATTDSMGCDAHVGPEAVVKEGKENQDFAFALKRQDQLGQDWLLMGVADGVTQAVWQKRGSQHAVAAFLAVLDAYFQEGIDPLTLLLEAEGPERFSEVFAADVTRRLQADMDYLVRERRAPRMLRSRPDFYYSYYFFSPTAEHKRQGHWFLTTLLAAALGPKGGFALLIGDGFARVDRCIAGQWQRQTLSLPAENLAHVRKGPGLVVNQRMQVSTIRSCIEILPAGEATELGVVLATDGVAKTSGHGLEERDLLSTEECQAYLRDLVSRPEACPDNMGVACARRRIWR